MNQFSKNIKFLNRGKEVRPWIGKKVEPRRRVVLTMISLLFPLFIFGNFATVYAQSQAPKNLTELVRRFIDILNQLTPWVLIVAGAIFFNGFLKYLTAGANEERLKVGRNRIIFGILALAISLSFWGIVILLKTSVFGS